MKRILQWAMVLTLSTAVTYCSRDEAQTINGTNGKNGSTILSGTTAPTLNIGEIGDYYLNKSTYDLYGPKTSDSWGTPINLKGREGSNGTAGSKIHAGSGIPAQNIGNNGDWYIDTQNKMLYGPKTDQGWGSGLSLGNGNSSSLKGNYVLSRDGKTLLQWFNKETTQIDMQSDPELKEVTNITNWVFHNYNHTSPHSFSLTNIILPDNLERIGNYTFTYNKLTNITIPNKVTTIGDFAFHSNNLTNATISGAETIGKEAFSNNQLTSVTIPNSVKSIEEGAFKNNKLTSVVIPNGITIINKEAFSNNQLTNVTIPNSVKSIEEGAFKNNKLTSIIIPNEITILNKEAFSNNQLTSVTIPNSVKSIEEGAFSGNHLTNVTIPNSVKSIEKGAFSGNGLTNISIPNGVTSIGKYAFFGNPLTNIVIPSSVTNIGPEAFAYGIPLHHVYPHISSITVTIHATNPPILEGSIFEIFSKHLVKIYVPAGSLAAYKTDKGWSLYASQIYAQ